MATQLFNQPTYLETFGLNEPPCLTNPDERFLYLTDKHPEVATMAVRVIQDILSRIDSQLRKCKSERDSYRPRQKGNI